MKKSLQYILISVILVYSCTSLAETITITADKADFDQALGVANYYSNVKLTQDANTLIAEQLKLQRGQNNKIKVVTATGNPTSFNSSTDNFAGEAKVIHFYPQDNVIELHENAVLVQNGDTITGPLLVYNLSSKELQSKGTEQEKSMVTINSKRAPK